MQMLAVTWTNDARGRSVFWLHALSGTASGRPLMINSVLSTEAEY
jgi:hypothetical protein